MFGTERNAAVITAFFCTVLISILLSFLFFCLVSFSFFFTFQHCHGALLCELGGRA